MPLLKHRDWRLWLTALIAAGAASLPVCEAMAAASLEYAVKANYLYKFTPFVEWPPRAFPQPSAPLVICVAGEDPFGSALDDAVRGQSFEGRPIAVRRLVVVTPGAACQVLFVGKSALQSPAEALQAVGGEPVLTVTDVSHGVEGGMIGFVMQGGHVRFDIDEAAARASGLTISSKLLGLALSHRKSE